MKKHEHSYRLIFDARRCIGCQACSMACRVEHAVPKDHFRLQVRIHLKGVFPHLAMRFERHACVMCEHAPCVDVCPTHASFQTKDGLVHIDPKSCIGCKYCILACPYHARFSNPTTHVAEKCDFCFSSRVSKRLDPACVSICPTDALVFAKLPEQRDTLSDFIKKERLEYPKAYLGTEPKVGWIVAEEGWVDE